MKYASEMPSKARARPPGFVICGSDGREVVTPPLSGPAATGSTGTAAHTFGNSERVALVDSGMELRQLRTFEAVVRHRTVTDAAVALAMAPSSVSEQIRTLEKSLGIALFERTPRGMRLTGAGERMLSWARRLLDQAEQARREVTGQRQALRLGALETIAATYMPRVLGRLAERRPGLRVEVRTSASRDDLLADVAAGRLEAAMLLDTGDVLGDLGFPAPPEPLAFLDVDAVPLVLVAANDHPLLGRPRLTPADLAGERLLVNVPNCSFFMAADKVFGGSPEPVHARGLGDAHLDRTGPGHRPAAQVRRVHRAEGRHPRAARLPRPRT